VGAVCLLGAGIGVTIGLRGGGDATADSKGSGIVATNEPTTLDAEAAPLVAVDAMPLSTVDAIEPVAGVPDAAIVPDAPRPSKSDTVRTTPRKSVAEAPKPPGELAILVKPWAHVWIDGVKKRDTPFRDSVSAGRHKIKIANESGKSETIAVTIESGKTFTIERDW
jgi:hypothetical protein